MQRPVLHLAYPYGDRIAAGQREFMLAKAAIEAVKNQGKK